jgi:hypothetical protein
LRAVQPGRPGNAFNAWRIKSRVWTPPPASQWHALGHTVEVARRASSARDGHAYRHPRRPNKTCAGMVTAATRQAIRHGSLPVIRSEVADRALFRTRRGHAYRHRVGRQRLRGFYGTPATWPVLSRNCFSGHTHTGSERAIQPGPAGVVLSPRRMTRTATGVGRFATRQNSFNGLLLRLCSSAP